MNFKGLFQHKLFYDYMISLLTLSADTWALRDQVGGSVECRADAPV